MIQNARAFRIGETPRAVVGRNSEQQQLSRCLSPITDGDPGMSVVLDGPAGAGKTTVAASTLEQLRQQSVTTHTEHLHCSGHSRWELLARLVRKTGIGAVTRGQSAADLLDRLGELTEPWVVVLDEVDAISDRDVLTDLWRLRAVTLVAITNDLQRLLAGVTDHSRSRIQSMQSIEFSRYHDDELVAILRDRIDWGLSPGASVPDDVLGFIARTANGDARAAISTLHQAALAAETEGRTTVEPGDVLDSIDDAAADVRERQLQKHSHHHRAVYHVLEDTGECDLDALYDGYCAYASDPRGKRMVQNYLADLVDYRLIERKGPKQDRTFVATLPIETDISLPESADGGAPR